MDIYFLTWVGHFCMITPGHFYLVITKPPSVGLQLLTASSGENPVNRSLWFAPWLSELYSPTKTLEVLNEMFT